MVNLLLLLLDDGFLGGYIFTADGYRLTVVFYIENC